MPQEFLLPAVFMLLGLITTLGATIVNAIFGQPIPAGAMTCTQIVADAALGSALIAQKNPAAAAALTGADVTGTVSATPLPGESPHPVPTPKYPYDLKQGATVVQVQGTTPGFGSQRACNAYASTNSEGPAPNSTLVGNP